MAERLRVDRGEPDVFVGVVDDSTEPDQLVQAIGRAPVSLLTDRPGEAAEPESIEVFKRRVEGLGVTPEFVGRMRGDGQSSLGTAVAILRGHTPPQIGPAPDDFKVVGIIVAYNEEDVIDQTIRHLGTNGVRVYLVDNWSTDSTLERARESEGEGLIGSERFPPDRPPDTYEWRRLLSRVEEIAAELAADWVVFNDADELRSPPWSGVALRDALWHVQQSGFSAVNHTCLNFALTQDTFRPGSSLGDHFSWFDPQRSDLAQVRTWRQCPGDRVDLASSGGHSVEFRDRKVFPYNFLLRHYPIRSVEQASRKVFRDRLPRFPINERLLGWHDHYDHLKPNRLLQPTTGLYHFDDSFGRDFLIERLTGVGFDPLPVPVTTKVRAARALRRLGLLDPVLSFRWRLAGRATKS